MRWWTKTLLWAGILLACAGVGAFIASRSNPFPPGVDSGPGGTPSRSPRPSEELPDRWVLAMGSRSIHTYRVGGACRSDWRMRARLRVFPGGRVVGKGTARLLSGASCDFETAQVQTALIDVSLTGRRVGSVLRLRFEETERRPAGSQDLGAFTELLPSLRVSLEKREGAKVSKRQEVSQPDGDVFAARTVLRLSR
jgi:hypothetical protein